MFSLRSFVGAFLFALTLLAGELGTMRAQSESSSTTQIQTLQKQLDGLQTQMTQIQGEINRLSAKPAVGTSAPAEATVTSVPSAKP